MFYGQYVFVIFLSENYRRGPASIVVIDVSHGPARIRADPCLRTAKTSRGVRVVVVESKTVRLGNDFFF